MSCYFNKAVWTLCILFFTSLRVNATNVSEFFLLPDGVSIFVRNSMSYPWTVNEKGELVSNMHKNYGSTTISFVNQSDKDLCCSFEMSVSSEANCDRFGFSCDGDKYQYISGELYHGSSPYLFISCFVKAGGMLSFEYTKDSSSSKGDDCGYIRNLKFSLPVDGDVDSEWGLLLNGSGTRRTASILAYYGESENVVVPSRIVRNGAEYSVTQLEEYAFSGNNAVKSVVVPSSVTAIGVYAFQDCENLQSVELPNSITSIGNYTFKGCKNLVYVNIPNRLNAIPKFMFEGCSSLKSIVIPSSVKTISVNAFKDCESLQTVNIPSSVATIDYFAFYNCYSLKNVFVPKTVTTINDNVFAGCKKLESIVVESGNRYYDSRNGCNAIVETASNVLISGCKNTVVPNDVIVIGMNAFYGNSELEHINIPMSVRGIAFDAFNGCSSLKSIELPGVVDVASSAFYNCTSLKYATMSGPISAIGQDAFYNCKSLSSVSFSNSLNTIGRSAFQNCSSLKSVVVPNSVSSIEDDVFAYCSNLQSVTIEGYVSNLSPNVFRHCGNLNYVFVYSPKVISIFDDADFSAGNAYDHITRFANCTLFVPSSSVDAYKSAKGWKQFGDVVCIPETMDFNVVSMAEPVCAGRQMKVDILMNNVKPISKCLFVMNLPNGFTLSNCNNPIYLDGQRCDGTDIALRTYKLVDNVYQINASSATGCAFTGTSGKVATILLDVDESVMPGEYFMQFSQVTLAEPSGADYSIKKVVSKLFVKENGFGDVNGDGKVDKFDVDGIVGFLVGKPVPKCSKPAADINGDGVISIVDCTLLVNEIINKSTP